MYIRECDVVLLLENARFVLLNYFSMWGKGHLEMHIILGTHFTLIGQTYLKTKYCKYNKTRTFESVILS